LLFLELLLGVLVVELVVLWVDYLVLWKLA
jgi:hypothetical protein